MITEAQRFQVALQVTPEASVLTLAIEVSPEENILLNPFPLFEILRDKSLSEEEQFKRFTAEVTPYLQRAVISWSLPCATDSEYGKVVLDMYSLELWHVACDLARGKSPETCLAFIQKHLSASCALLSVAPIPVTVLH